MLKSIIMLLIIMYIFLSRAAKFSLPRLYTLLAAKIRGLHPEYELSLIDLVRPKKSLTLEIVALLINAIMFNKNCRFE